MVELNEYLTIYSGGNLSDKIGEKELKKILLNSVPNKWSNYACIWVFDCETIALKILWTSLKFERLKISETIYEGVVEYYFGRTIGEIANCACYIMQWG